MKKIGFSIVLAGLLFSSLNASGVPVGDGANLSQNLTSYIKQVADFIQTQAQWAKENADRTLQQVNQVKQTIAQGQQWINDKIDDSRQWIDETGINDLRREIDDMQRTYEDGLRDYKNILRVGNSWKNKINGFDGIIRKEVSEDSTLFDDLLGEGVSYEKYCEPDKSNDSISPQNGKIWSEQYESEEGICKQRLSNYAMRARLVRKCKKNVNDIREATKNAMNVAMRNDKREVSYGGGSGTGAGLTTTTIEGGSSKKTADISLQLAYNAQELQRVKDFCEENMKELQLKDSQSVAQERSIRTARASMVHNGNNELYDKNHEYLKEIDKKANEDALKQ